MRRPLARIALAAFACGSIAGAAPPFDRVLLTSPKSAVSIELQAAEGRLSYRVSLGRTPAIEPSRAGIIVDGVDLGDGVTLGAVENYRVDERYPWRGMHREAVNRANGARVTVIHRASGLRYGVDLRAYDDGAAFRTIVPGRGPAARVPDAAAAFTLPPGASVWSHGLRDHYEAQYERQAIESVPAGGWVGPPITAKLADNAGYLAIMEADLRGYAGMVLQADGNRVYRERLAHAAPVGYPFTLRFGDAEAARLAEPAAIVGTITTPWRVVLVAPDLNALVNSDIVHNLTAPPDLKLFPQGLATPWLKPGRAVWRYLDGGDNTFEGIKEFSRLAGELGFEHHVVEGLWQKWSEAQLKELVDYSRERGVGIWVWRHRNTLGEPEKRRELFSMLQKIGVSGVKVDFLDHEAKEVIDLYEAILKDGYAGRFYNQFGSELAEASNQNALAQLQVPWTDPNGNRRVDAGELNLATFTGFAAGLFPPIADDAKRPYSDEFNVGVDHQLMRDLAVSFSYHRRQHRNGLTILDRARPESAYTAITRTYTDPGRSGSQSIVVYTLDPALATRRDRIITNVDGLKSDYDGVQFSVNKRMSNRWQMLAGLTFQSHEGFSHEGTFTDTLTTNDFNNPNFRLNRDASAVFTDIPWTFTLSGSYMFPYDISFSGKYTARDGDPLRRMLVVSGLAQGSDTVWVQPRGEDRTETVNKFVDIRFAKRFAIGRSHLEGSIDIFNLLNANHVLLQNEAIGTTVGRPSRILAPRIIRFGVTARF